MAAKKPIVLSLSGTSDASGNLTLKTKAMAPGKLLCIQLVAVYNAETDNCLADVGFERAGLQGWLETLVLTTHARWYPYYHPFWIPSDYQVVIKFSSGGSGKLCNAWVLGYLAPDAGEE